VTSDERPFDAKLSRPLSRGPRVLLDTLLVAALSAVCSLSIAVAMPAATADAAGPSAAERVPIDPAALAAAAPAAPPLLVALDASAAVANAVADASAVAPGDDAAVLDAAAPGALDTLASEAGAARAGEFRVDWTLVVGHRFLHVASRDESASGAPSASEPQGDAVAIHFTNSLDSAKNYMGGPPGSTIAPVCSRAYRVVEDPAVRPEPSRATPGQ
jgi:hypothetical protein